MTPIAIAIQPAASPARRSAWDRSVLFSLVAVGAGAARAGIIPRLIPRDLRPAGSALSMASCTLGMTVGPLVGSAYRSTILQAAAPDPTPVTEARACAIVERMATEDDVRRRCLSMPGVTERPSWGQPAWFARTLMARIWEEGVVTVKTEERDALAGMDPETYFWTPHHERSPRLVLVRLDRVADDELDELLRESYRLAGSPRRG